MMIILDKINNFISYNINKRIACRNDCRINRKVVVIESDDWGSIRLPSKKIRDNLFSKGINLNYQLGYDYCDSIATEKDLIFLMDILNSVRDINSNPCIITFNCVTANPDFYKIKESNYSKYFYETIDQTFKKYNGCNNSLSLWREGIDNLLVKPQFHGREHLNVPMWLNSLLNDFDKIRLSFDNGVYFPQVREIEDKRRSHLRAYDVINNHDYKFIENSVVDGLKIFEKLFGYRPLSFIAPNYTWDPIVESYLHKEGIKYIQGSYFQKFSSLEFNKTGRNGSFNYFGKSNNNNQKFLIRNCLWEPSQNKKLNNDYCLKSIEKAFNNNKPAIICSHRLNFIGSIEEKNRDQNLRQFEILLKTIVKKWPDVEFMSSDQLGQLINNDI